MLTRRDFIKGLGVALASYGGAKLLLALQHEMLVSWGRKNGVISPVWRGWKTAESLPRSMNFSLTFDVHDPTQAETWSQFFRSDKGSLVVKLPLSTGENMVIPVRLNQIEIDPGRGAMVHFVEDFLGWPDES